jgi:hypothetical protein
MRTAQEAVAAQQAAQSSPQPVVAPSADVVDAKTVTSNNESVSAEGSTHSEGVNSTTEQKTESLIDRVGKYQPSKPKVPTNPQGVDDKFDYREIESIEDPKAKELALKAYKSFEKGYQQKFQSLADERREIERLRQESSKWTPERIAKALQDQSFIEAAQAYQTQHNPVGSGKSDEEWSSMTESEKASFTAMQNKIAAMEQQNSFKEMQHLLEKQHSELSSKYSTYNRNNVEQLFNDMSAGRIQASLEHFHKVVDYEPAIERAYQMGLEDASKDVQDKMNANTNINGGFSVRPNTGFTKNENENSKSFFTRIMLENLTKNKK